MVSTSSKFSCKLPLRVFLVSWILVLLCAPSPAVGQVLYGSIVGNVTDETRGAVPGATVTIVHNESGASREVVTDSMGGYRFPAVQSGTYTVTVNASTSRTRCDQPCPGSSCTVSFAVRAKPEEPRIPDIIVPCGPIFFPFNSARINNEHKACLDDIALRMQQDPRATVVIDGHRDSTERVGISLTRANNARDYLVNEKGIDSSRITVRNYGDTCSHESGDANLNRRVEFFILPERATMEAVDQMKKCGSGSSPRIITDETPAESVDPRRPTRRTPRRRVRR
jgi:outer membrane protein OmpA-like peptidoglycan-associated protein